MQESKSRHAKRVLNDEFFEEPIIKKTKIQEEEEHREELLNETPVEPAVDAPVPDSPDSVKVHCDDGGYDVWISPYRGCHVNGLSIFPLESIIRSDVNRGDVALMYNLIPQELRNQLYKYMHYYYFRRIMDVLWSLIDHSADPLYVPSGFPHQPVFNLYHYNVSAGLDAFYDDVFGNFVYLSK